MNIAPLPARLRPLLASVAALACVHVVAAPTRAQPRAHAKQFTADLGAERCSFTDVGRNAYFVLEPGHQLRLAGETRRGYVEVTATVLTETRLVDGVLTRVVEEVERVDGTVTGITRLFHAMCVETNDAYVFGVETTLPTDGDDGGTAQPASWMAGRDGARPGIAMPGRFMLGARYQLEQAPGVALDRAENVEMHISVDTPAGRFEDCVATIETSPLEPSEEALVIHAEGIGRVVDEELRLIGWTPGVTQ